ncbi:MAG TPA: tRNA pseudouridine(38-40) synthase TruA [Sphaerochaeta sp.]|nr:tRNA pseudouridine(38-40) synthase TruA [Sphaerochaeta sp.]HPZ15292.1 tRNA pseudouridine(38-40) synthase TruA [Sphaerochaeta sp.]
MARSDWRRPDLLPLEAGLRRIRMTISYHGGHYSGWQRQQNATAVAQVVEEAVLALLGEEVEVVGSGRTDSGVHALAQVCHMDIANPRIKADKLAIALNRHLPPDIRILESSEVDGSFHARFTTMARTYRYYYKRHGDVTGFDGELVATVKEFPPLDLLQSYASAVAGTHDFTTFTASGDLCPSKFRDIYESYWRLERDRWGGELLTYTITGNAFLYKMVRSLVGSMMEFAYQGISGEEFAARLAAKDRRGAGRTASASGLYLYRISYDEGEYAWFEEDNDE